AAGAERSGYLLYGRRRELPHDRVHRGLTGGPGVVVQDFEGVGPEAMPGGDRTGIDEGHRSPEGGRVARREAPAAPKVAGGPEGAEISRRVESDDLEQLVRRFDGGEALLDEVAIGKVANDEFVGAAASLAAYA